MFFVISVAPRAFELLVFVTVCASSRIRLQTGELQVCLSPGLLFSGYEGRTSILQRHSDRGGVREAHDGKQPRSSGAIKKVFLLLNAKVVLQRSSNH